MTIHLPKVNEFGGGNGGGGGSSSFPIIVTSSGSSLPSASGYQLNDTFLNTTDKKIYKAIATGYQLSSGTLNNDNNVVIDFETGLASNFGMTFSQYVNIYRQISRTENFTWSGNKTIDLHFKLSEGLNDTHYYPLFESTQYGFSFALFLKSDGLYFIKYKVYQSSFELVSNTKILDFSWQSNTEYYLRLDKVDGNTTISLSNIGYDTNNIKKETVEIEDFYGYYQSSSVIYVSIGTSNSRLTSYNVNIYNGITPIQVYLLDTTTKNYLTPTTELSWDSGIATEDKTEYADKTNGILYLYENEELVAINTPSSFSSITGNATDNTSLATALSSKKDKAETITISTASVTIANVQANKNYVLSSSALTDITLTACETSFEETTIEFTTGSTAPTLTDNSGITWVDGSAPTLKASKSYIIVIFNKIGFVKEY